MQCLDLHKRLAPVDSARYDSRYAAPGCLKGTRISVLDQLHEWVRSPSPAFSVFWLSGTAGTGKTTIAKTFCEEVARAGFTVASFFISRQDEARRDPGNIVRSLAYDLATHNWSRAQAIWNELNSIPHMLSLTIPEQVKHLLSKPSGLEYIDDFPIIIIIDALDESTESNNDHDRKGHLIPLLVSALKHQVVKIFVTSRNEQYISNYMDGNYQDALRLHHMEKSDASKDVRSFFETKFRQLVESRNLRSDWPSSSDLDVLVERTEHLFVYAATIMSFVSDMHEDPEQQLESILDYKREPMEGDDGVFEQLDKLYAQVIQAVVMRKGVLNTRRRDRVRMLIGMVIILQRPLPFPSIIDMMITHDKKYSKQAIRTDLEALSSVIPVPQADGDPVQIYHPSFPEFIQDSNRCKDHGLHVSSSEASLSVAIACLRLMNKNLDKDLCMITDPTLMNNNIYDLQERLDHFVPESLRYACIHWTSHVVSAPVTSPLLKELEEFCKNHIFHWIEVLSLLGNLSSAVYGLRRMWEWCQVSPCHPVVIYVISQFTDESRGNCRCTFSITPRRCCAYFASLRLCSGG
jgi:hypothetical protein